MCAVSQAWIFLFWVCPSCSPLPKHGVLLSWASVWHPRVSGLDTRNCTFTPTDCWPSKQLPLSAKNQYINIRLCVFICKQWFVKTARSLNGVIKVCFLHEVFMHLMCHCKFSWTFTIWFWVDFYSRKNLLAHLSWKTRAWKIIFIQFDSLFILWKLTAKVRRELVSSLFQLFSIWRCEVNVSSVEYLILLKYRQS